MTPSTASLAPSPEPPWKSRRNVPHAILEKRPLSVRGAPRTRASRVRTEWRPPRQPGDRPRGADGEGSGRRNFLRVVQSSGRAFSAERASFSAIGATACRFLCPRRWRRVVFAQILRGALSNGARMRLAPDALSSDSGRGSCAPPRLRESQVRSTDEFRPRRVPTPAVPLVESPPKKISNRNRKIFDRIQFDDRRSIVTHRWRCVRNRRRIIIIS